MSSVGYADLKTTVYLSVAVTDCIIAYAVNELYGHGLVKPSPRPNIRS